MRKQKISCLINTYNAQEFLEDVMRAAKFVDEFVVVDMGSTDQTLEIAKRFGAKIFDFPNVGFADPAREFGVSKTSHEWVIILDADEIVTPGFKNFVEEQLIDPQYDVYYMYFRNFFFGRELKATSWSYKDFRKPLFFKKGFVELRPIVHNFFRLSKLLEFTKYQFTIMLLYISTTQIFLLLFRNLIDTQILKNLVGHPGFWYLKYSFK